MAAFRREMCVYYGLGGVCEFRQMTQCELNSLNRLEQKTGGLNPENPYRKDLLTRLQNIPSLAVVSELSGIVLCDARGFKGTVSKQTPVLQKGCNCYKPENYHV